MRNPVVAALIALIAGGAAGIAAAMMIGAFGMGICWIFIFGDDPWPDWVEPALGIVVVGAGIIMALVTAWIVFNQLRATDRAGGI